MYRASTVYEAIATIIVFVSAVMCGDFTEDHRIPIAKQIIMAQTSISVFRICGR